MFIRRPDAHFALPGGESADVAGFAFRLSQRHAKECGNMSTFDDPFDAGRKLSSSGCACGRHGSAAEHEQAALPLRCEPVPTEEARYQGVVASAVMRAMFPKDAARRAFLKSVGASTALAAISQFFPLKTAAEAFADAGTPEKKDLKVGFIPITCATPIIMAAPLGFYAKHGLNVEVVKTAGWAVVRDKTITRNTTPLTCWRRCRSRSRWGSARSRFRSQCPRSRTSTGRASRLRSSTRTSATPRTGRA